MLFIVSLIWYFLHSERGKLIYSKIILKTPYAGKIVMNIALINLARSIGTMLRNGVSILKALDVSRYITKNVIIQQALEKTALKIKRGISISQAFDDVGIFPEIIIYMIGVGEETGKLGEIFLQIANDFEKKTKEILNRFMKVFEPFIILLMGIIIGYIVISMILPVMGLNTNLF